MYDRLEKYDLALSDYDQAIQLDLKDPLVYYNRGNVHESLQQYDASLIDYTQATELKQDFAQAYSDRGLVHKELGRYRSALRLQPGHSTRPDEPAPVPQHRGSTRQFGRNHICFGMLLLRLPGRDTRSLSTLHQGLRERMGELSSLLHAARQARVLLGLAVRELVTIAATLA